MQYSDHSTFSGDTREADHGLSVKLQVQKLILQATSHENLCQNYVGYVFMELSQLAGWLTMVSLCLD